METQSMTWVKLCSMKCRADILAAADAEPDAVGFLVGQKHTSNDFISPAQARELAKLLPQKIAPVLVTHLARAEDIYQLASETEINSIQLHGDSSLEQVVALRKLLPHSTLIYAAHVIDGELSVDVQQFSPYIDMLLLDSCDPALGKVGGTGLVHDWNISAEIIRTSSVPVILAGGLNPDNVAQAIKQVKPFGVDVNSGVKNRDGLRSAKQCSAFVKNAQS